MRAYDMTAAEFLADFLPRWQATRPPRYTPDIIAGFLRRQRGVLEVLVQRALARCRAERGELPDTIAEFAAYDDVVERERRRDAQSDAGVLQHLVNRVKERVVRDHEPEITVLAMLGDDYVSTRTEAILLRHAGWDAVPLMLKIPALAVVVAGSVVALRNTMGHLAIHPLQRGALNHLLADIHKAEIRTLYLRDAVDITRGTYEQMVRFAMALWASARKPASAGVATPRRPT